MATSSVYLCRPATSATGNKHVFPTGSPGFLVFGGHRLSNRLVTRKSVIRADLDSMVSDMSTNGLEVTWSSVVKIGQSLYREEPGKDPFRPDQKTPVENFFLAGSYTKQDYIDSMEGATLSGRQASAYICNVGEQLVALRKKITAAELNEISKGVSLSDELSLV